MLAWGRAGRRPHRLADEFLADRPRLGLPHVGAVHLHECIPLAEDAVGGASRPHPSDKYGSDGELRWWERERERRRGRLV